MKRRELARHARDLDFTPRDAVRWLSPRQLARTGVKVLISAVFADYADKREIQAGLAGDLLCAPLDNPDSKEDVWIDFTADLGDGFDATYTVASLLAAEQLTVQPANAGGLPEVLPRGCLLVLGGDEVYPTASTPAYEDRTTGPYRAALPQAANRPLMVALPGNHDWYDGLTSFLRIFTHRRAIGGWRMTQSRSYFAVKLPHNWWLLGLDSQFGTYIDEPQLDYFEEHVSRNLKSGDGIILCSATPVWVKSAEGDSDAFNKLHWFDQNYLRRRPVGEGREETGASVRLWITGDSHHYARYAEQAPGDTGDVSDDPRQRQMVTCGVGGAFLSATHQLPPELPIPSPASRLREKDAAVSFARAASLYPPEDQSRRMSRQLAMPWRPEWLPRRNPGFFSAAATVHVLAFLLLICIFGRDVGRRPISAIRESDVGDAVAFGWKATLAVAILLALIWALRLVLTRQFSKPIASVVGALLQLVVMLGILLVAVTIRWSTGLDDWLVLLGCCAIAAIAGAVLGSGAFALYIVLAKTGSVVGWQMSGQSIEDHKGFIRMHIDPAGNLTLYPLAVDQICRDWAVETGEDGVKRPRPEKGLPVPRLLESKVTIARSGH